MSRRQFLLLSQLKNLKFRTVTNNLEQKAEIIHIDSVGAAESHAPPLQLQDRDWKELVKLFDRKDNDEIEADIMNKLRWLVPEPCWEDDPYDFLEEYI